MDHTFKYIGVALKAHGNTSKKIKTKIKCIFESQPLIFYKGAHFLIFSINPNLNP